MAVSLFFEQEGKPLVLEVVKRAESILAADTYVQSNQEVGLSNGCSQDKANNGNGRHIKKKKNLVPSRKPVASYHVGERCADRSRTCTGYCHAEEIQDGCGNFCRNRNYEYLPITGLAAFNALSAKLILGDSW